MARRQHGADPSGVAAALLAGSSIEINAQDAPLLGEARQWLAEGTRVFVSHLPRQAWQATADACAAVRRAGFEPVPHLPVRLLRSQADLADVLALLRAAAAPRELLVLSGDYPVAAGPYYNTALALQSGLFESHGIRAVCMAGHPEGHPSVDLAELRRAELHKCRVAAEHGLAATLVTQLLFESQPYVDWSASLAARHVPVRTTCGLAGPARLATLVKFAMRCGVGPSIRALGVQGGNLLGLVGERSPDRLIVELAAAMASGRCPAGGIHLFCFGGFLHTAQWLAGRQRDPRGLAG